MRLIATLLLLAGLAGCLGETAPPLADDDVPDDPYLEKPALQFRPPVDLGSKAGVMNLGVGGVGTSCQDSVDDGDCGLGEPSVEVDAAGTIYVSGVCCLTVAPPVYVSRDGGETFALLEHPVRDAWGIEGDFAISSDGKVYFADIEFAGTFQVTVWDKDGEPIRHTKWPAPPLVDRDWIRAEGTDTVYYIYNTGSATRVYKSTDAAATFSADAIYVAPYALGNAAIWPEKELCLAASSGRVDCSRDGGAAWANEMAPLGAGGNFPVPVHDEAGNLYYIGINEGRPAYASRPAFDADNVYWSNVTHFGPNGTHRMPWAAAGADGAMAVAWYGTENETIGADTEWYVYVAASRDATAANPRWDWTIADPEPVFKGILGRDLLDFLQIDMGPDGALHVAYSKQYETPGPDGNEEQLTYIRSEASPLAALDYFWGP